MGRSLRQVVASKSSLWKAWSQVRAGSSPYSYGPDNITLREFGAAANDHLKRIRDELESGTFRFTRPRGYAIRKKANAEIHDLKAWRPIVIPNICDRVVQRAMLNATWSRLRKYVCTAGSFGGIRPYRIRRTQASDGRLSRRSGVQENVRRCVSTAAAEICRIRDSGKRWLFETDIASFFPSIDRGKLLPRLAGVLEDDSLNELFDGAVATSISNYAEKGPLQALWDPERGVPQGGILSPILANFYLQPLDIALKRGRFSLIRYVDDLVVLCRDEEEAIAAEKVVREQLSELALDMHPGKTQILPPGRTFTFLGLDFTTYAIRPTEAKFKRIEERVREITDVKANLKLHDLIQRINLRLRGWVQAYKFCSLTPGDLERIDRHVEKCVRRWLNRRGLLHNKNTPLPADTLYWLGVARAAKFPIHPILKPRRAQRLLDRQRLSGHVSMLTLAPPSMGDAPFSSAS